MDESLHHRYLDISDPIVIFLIKDSKLAV